MKKYTYLLLALFLITIVSFNVAADKIRRSPRVNINGLTGNDFIAQTGVLYPFLNKQDSLWFTDLRYRMSGDTIKEWNIGLGYRKKIDQEEKHIAGIYAYRDMREEYDHYWDMWTIGGEILSDQWDFRINTYITEDEKVLAPFSTGSTSAYVNSSGKIVISPGNEVYYKSMNGIDMELGKKFTELDNIFKNIGIYVKVYSFYEDETPTITGKQVRINKEFGDSNKTTWKLGALWRDDNVRGSETKATFAVSIPFGKGAVSEKNSQDVFESRMIEQPERDLDIVVGESVSQRALTSEEKELTAYDSKGKELGRVWYVTTQDNDNTEGTKDKPIDIDYLINNVIIDNEVEINSVQRVPIIEEPVGEANDVIVFMGGDNEFDLGTKRLDLKYGQKILSTGYGKLAVTSKQGEIETMFTPEGKRAKLTGDQYLVLLNGNNTVSGFELKNSNKLKKIISNPAIKGYIDINNNIFSSYEEVINESINEVKLRGPADHSYINIDVSGTEAVQIDIEDNIFDRSNIMSIPNTSENAIKISNSNNSDIDINISGNTIDEFYAGIYIENLDVANPAEISDNEIKNSVYGIYFNDIAGSDNEDKLTNLKKFDIDYENSNEISGSINLDVFDHIINNWYDLNAVRKNVSSVYLMKSNLTSETEGYQELASDAANGGAGWDPIAGPHFQGIFDGNNKVISDLIINRRTEDNVGLFKNNYTGAIIKNIGLANVNIIGNKNVGGLVGLNEGSIENSYVAGEITAEGRIEMSGTEMFPMQLFYLGEYVGGIAGKNSGYIIDSHASSYIKGDANTGGITGENTGSIINSYSKGILTGTNSVAEAPTSFINVGGLAGSNSGSIKDSYSTGNINGELFYQNVGGLVGNNSGDIEDSYVSGTLIGSEKTGGLVGNNAGVIIQCYSEIDVITDDDYIGGLVGNNDRGIISNSYSTGSVFGSDSVGGLVGYSYMGDITNNFAEGQVEGNSGVGGLVGYNNTTNINGSYALGNVYSVGNGAGGLVGDNVDGSISESYAEGDVDSDGHNVGGLIGNNGGSISNSYAKGSAHGYDSVGGLAGYNIISGSIEKSYSISQVTANNNNYLGGLVGYNSGGTVDNSSYWDTVFSGISNSDGGTGLTTTEMKDSSNYNGWDFSDTWGIDSTINDGYPYLK